MAKKVKVVTTQSVKHAGKYQPLGTELSLDTKEAARLIEIGAVELPRPVMPETEEPQD